jgi:riboflavin kinase/FMN adenylyltransferase
MRVVENILEETLTDISPVVTIGSFDGIHLGHRRILDVLQEKTGHRGGSSVVVTMRPHPRVLFSPEYAANLLTPDEKKIALLREAGMDVVAFLPFTREVAEMPRQAFVEQVLVARCRAKCVVVGHDFRFGCDAAGDYEYLCAAGEQYGFSTVQVPPLHIDGERVSSTSIRERILHGDLDKVERYLGRPYSLCGKVGSGRGVGVQLGFPTANIHPLNSVIPPHGVYAAEVVIEGAERHCAAVNIGIAPTIRDEDITVEAFLLNFTGDLRNRDVEIVLHKRMRPERKFASREELMAAIAQDVAGVAAFFAAS